MPEKTLKELQDSDLPHADLESIDIEISLDGVGDAADMEEAEAERDMLIEALNNYLRKFTPGEKVDDPGPLTGGILCPMCGRVLNGFFGTFQWGIRHGEGECTNCGYPARGMHHIKNEEGDEIATFSNFILPYHPDELKELEDEDD